MTETHSFFSIVPPGLEVVARRELEYWLRQLGAETAPLVTQPGGIAMQLSLRDGFALNGVVKIPTRILLRVAEFRCRDFPALFKHMQKISWRKFVELGPVTWSVSARESRLGHEKRIEQTCTEAYAAFHRGHEPKAQASTHPLEVFVRAEKDVFTVSVDTSGEALFRRGYRSHVGEAPVRESLAAALLWTMGATDLDKPVALLDPMMGAGTFLLEAYHLKHVNQFRSFAMTQFPCCPSELRDSKWWEQTFSPTLHFSQLFGRDLDAKAVEAAAHNLKSAGVPRSQLAVADFWQNSLPALEGPAWVVCNPPYGERLQISDPPIEYCKKLLARMAEIPAVRYGWILPKLPQPAEQLLPKGLKLEHVVPFRNGGIPVQFVVARLRTRENFDEYTQIC